MSTIIYLVTLHISPRCISASSGEKNGWERADWLVTVNHTALVVQIASVEAGKGLAVQVGGWDGQTMLTWGRGRGEGGGEGEGAAVTSSLAMPLCH